ncbi:MAG: hypothetical protein IJ352_06320 [Muribaculaceae bacterium]|nr:hypothetical protein [Muribaculaceae bacterium]
MRKLQLCLVNLLAVMFLAFVVSCEDEKNKPGDDPDTPSPEELQEMISPQYVSVDWTTADVLMCDTITGKYVMTKTAETSQIAPGSVVVLDMDTTGIVIRVTEVVDNTNEVNVKAERGTIADIFANIDFTLSTSTEAESRSKNVFYPEKIICRDSTGRLLSRTSFTKPIWEWGKNFDGTTLFQNSAVHLYFREANMSASVGLNMYFNFGQRTIIETAHEVWDKYRAQMLEVEATLDGEWNANFILQADVSGSYTFDKGEDLVKHNLLPRKSIKFVVYGVPVWIDLSADLYRHVKLTCEGEASAYAGVRNNITGKFGFNWQQQSGMSKVSGLGCDTEIIYPTITGKGRVDAKAWLYPRLRMTLYGLVGPSFDIKPYVGTEARGGFKQTMLGSSSDYFAWSLRNYCGVDINAGLSLMFMNYETKRYALGDINVIDKDLYKSPHSIELGSAPDKVKVGEAATISFVVKDYDYIFGQTTVTPLAQIVKFEGDGTLSSNYGITSNGTVSVTWKPSDKNDKLSATLYDYTGSIIDRAEYTSVEDKDPEDEITPGQEVDLGLSVNWAGWNVGASSPEEYGDYYAWGETEAKSDYDYDTYKYWVDRNGDGYVDYNEITNIGTNISGTQYDVARQKWGGSWRMPTKAEIDELTSKCIWTWYQYKGVWGQKVTGPNGNSIFMPAAGGRYGTSLYDDGSLGYYWSATLDEGSYCGHNARNLYFSNGSYGSGGSFDRAGGYTVRPVK